MRNSGLVVFFLVLMIAAMVVATSATFLNFWISIIIFETGLIWALVWLLSRGVPTEIIETAKNNCYRIDGTKSPRREQREQKAITGFRLDLLAVMVMVVLSGNLLILAIDCFVIPLPVVSESLSLFSFDLDAWRDQIGDRNLDRDFLLWQGFGQLGNNEMQQQPHFVKSSFPVVLVALVLWMACGLLFVSYSYQYSIKKYSHGIRSRCNEYLNLDIGRMQG